MSKSHVLPLYFWLLKFTRPYIYIVLGLLSCLLIVSVLEIAIIKLIQVLIDDTISNRNNNYIKILLYVTLISIVVTSLTASSTYLKQLLQLKIKRDIQLKLYEKLRELGLKYFEKKSVGEILSLFNIEVNQVLQLFNHYLPLLITNLLYVIVSFSLLITQNYKLSIILILCFLIYMLIGPMLEKKTALVGVELAQKRALNNHKLHETISSINEFKLYNSLDWQHNNYLNVLKQFNRKLLNFHLLAQIRGSVRRLIFHIGTISLFSYSFYLVINDELSYGQFVVFTLLFVTTVFKLTMIVTYITDQRIILNNAKNLYDYIQLLPEVAEEEGNKEVRDVKGEIELRNISYYVDGKQTLKNISLIIKPGERIALVGPSGSGKSTLLKLLARFYDPSIGEIYIDKVPIKSFSFKQLREYITLVFQESFIFSTTIINNLKFVNPNASLDDIISATTAGQAEKFIKELPDGYNTVLKDRGLNLSGGQKQRISLSRVFLKNSKIILLDEVTSSLDNYSEERIINSLESFLKNQTVVLTTHKLALLKICTRIIVMNNGEIEEDGSYENLMAKKGRFHELVRGEQLLK